MRRLAPSAGAAPVQCSAPPAAPPPRQGHPAHTAAFAPKPPLQHGCCGAGTAAAQTRFAGQQAATSLCQQERPVMCPWAPSLCARRCPWRPSSPPITRTTFSTSCPATRSSGWPSPTRVRSGPDTWHLRILPGHRAPLHDPEAARFQTAAAAAAVLVARWLGPSCCL